MLEKRVITAEPIDSLLARRWSCRSFDPNKKISRQQIISLCEAGRWAPSCFGDEPWRFIVWDKNHDEAAFMRAFNCLGAWNQGWVKNCNVLLLALADDKFRKNQEPNRWAQFDTGAACENIYLQAVSLGLMAHPMGGFDENKIKQEFAIPDNYTAMAMIAVSYQAEPETLDETYRKAEIDERFRRPLGSIFFDSYWDKPVFEDIPKV